MDERGIGKVRQGLQMSVPPDEARLSRERALLRELEGAPAKTRVWEYMKLIGPGYMQSAMTLGGGTMAASLFAGAAFGYQLLWAAPVGMLLGIIMLSAISYQTLSTGQRPYQAMLQHAGKPFAYGWAAGAVISSIVWHFPQYSLASACLADMGAVVGFEGLPPAGMSFIVLGIAVSLSWMYGSSPRLVRVYERVLKYMVWGIIFAFGLVLIKIGIKEPGAILKGFTSFSVPESREGVQSVTLIISSMAAAVGINMVFLYPYSLLARGWGREHRRLARFDLFAGMFVPFVIATSLIIIVTASTPELYENFAGKGTAPVKAAQTLSTHVGDILGRVVFNGGVFCMALSSITLQMLCAGFVAMEVFGWEFGSRRYRLATLLPTPGVLGPLIWSKHLLWLAIPTNIFCGLFLPIAYVGFIILQRKRDYLDIDSPTGNVGRLWIIGMVLAIATLVVGMVSYFMTKF